MSIERKKDVLTDEETRAACGWGPSALSGVRRRKRMAMTPLVRSLRGRFGGLKALANELRMSRSHLSEVLMNRKGRGGIVRKKVAAIMTPEELHMAGWNADGTLMEKRPPVSSAEIKRRIRRVI